MPQTMLLVLAISYAALLTTGVSGASASEPQAPERSSCPAKCGDVDVPYPFGIGDGCSLSPSFALTCNETTSPPTLYTGNVKIANITLETAQMVIYTHLTYNCREARGSRTLQKLGWGLKVTDPFLISPSDNVFTALGCSSTARLTGSSEDTAAYLTGCITTCAKVNNTGDDGTACSGHGCCQASITPGLKRVSVEWDSNEKAARPVSGNRCQYAFIATKGWYSYRKKDLSETMAFVNRLGHGHRPYDPIVPLVLDWAIRNGTCPPALEGDDKETIPYACVSNHSYCVNASNQAAGYFCNCSRGYTGNPYTRNGCTNIDECALRRSPNSTLHESMYPCHGGTCHDTEGTISAIAVLSVLLIFLHTGREKRKLRDRFNRNGGSFLKSAKIEIFTKEKLNRITNKYSCIIGRGAFGKVYKGTTGAGAVAVKRSIVVNEDRQKDFANEITVQSKISHPNLVRLVGCCLESEVPMLVYEFVPRGSLQDVLHGNSDPLPLETRLDIAINSAKGLDYMHSQSQMILHGDVKSGNILLNDDFTPKVSDFGTSRLMSIDKDHTNWVVGDSSYIDPVYMKTGLLTEKSDVYSFGIVLLELFTRKKARYGENRSLPIDYIKASKDGTTRQMFDEEVSANVKENMECLEEVGKIAVQCLEEDVNNRPTMGEVKEKLEKCKSQWLQFAKPGMANEICP